MTEFVPLLKDKNDDISDVNNSKKTVCMMHSNLDVKIRSLRMNSLSNVETKILLDKVQINNKFDSFWF